MATLRFQNDRRLDLQLGLLTRGGERIPLPEAGLTTVGDFPLLTFSNGSIGAEAPPAPCPDGLGLRSDYRWRWDRMDEDRDRDEDQDRDQDKDGDKDETSANMRNRT